MQDKKINDFEDNPTQDYLWRLIKEDDEEIVRRLEAEKKAKRDYMIQVVSVIIGAVGLLITVLTLAL